jgi:carbonic anhydrase
LDVIFDVNPSEISCTAMLSLQSCSEDDGGAAAVELALSGHSEIELVLVMETIGIDDTADEATKRIWLAMERLLRHSKSLRWSIQKGSVRVSAALLELATGRVIFLGEHAKQDEFFASVPRVGFLRRNRTKYFVEKELKPVVPGEEALAMLQCGNLRAAHRAVPPARAAEGMTTARSIAPPRSGNQVESDQLDPFAFIFMAYDAHKGEGPPANVLFDVHPSEIAAVSTVPWPTDDSEETYAQCNEEEQWKSHVHLAEHLLSTKAPRLLLVLGIAPVGALVQELQKIKEKVFRDIWNIFGMSTTIKAGVADGQLQVCGAIYHATAMDAQWQTRWTLVDGLVQTPPGLVEWLGAHPRQEVIIAAMAGMFPPTSILSAKNLAELLPPACDSIANTTLQELLAGNRRFLSSHGKMGPKNWTSYQLANAAKVGRDPKAIVLASAHGSVHAPERLFDTQIGEMLVHRTCGAICGRRHGCAMHALEEMLKDNPRTPVLFVLGDVKDPVISSATSQVQSQSDVLKHPNAQLAMEQLAPAVVHALHTMQGSCTNLYQDELALLTTQLHVHYVMERLLVDSDLVINLVSSGHLEVCGAVVQTDGSVHMLSKPDVHRLIGQKARVDRHRRKGVGLGQEKTQH